MSLRYVAYVTSFGLHLVDMRRPREARFFAATPQGQEAFGAAARALAGKPLRLLVDLVEEEFRTETVPHAGLFDRAAMLERVGARVFRNTPFRASEVQERLKTGRRDDRVLLTALTHVELLLPWIERLDAAAVPLAGIHSCGLMGPLLLPPALRKERAALLVVEHPHAGLRQTFFEKGNTRLSRLMAGPPEGFRLTDEQLASEIDKTRRYLQRLQLLAWDTPLHVHLIARDAPAVADLQGVAALGFEGLPAVAARLGLRAAEGADPGAAIYGQLLARRRVRDHYSRAEDRRHHLTGQLRQAAVLGGALVGGALAAGAVYLGIEGFALRAEVAGLATQTHYYDTLHQQVASRVANAPIELTRLKSAVDGAEQLLRYPVSPAGSLAPVGAVLAQHPSLFVTRVDWLGADARAKADQVADGTVPEEGAEATANAGPVVTLHGEIRPFDGSYRRALDEIDRVARALERRRGVAAVEILRQPIDLRATESVNDDAGIEGQKRRTAGFVIRVHLDSLREG